MKAILSFEDFQKCAAVLIAATGKPMAEETVDVYYELLSDISYPVLRAACARAIQESKDSWLPSVGVIRSHASDAAYGALPGWSEEWAEVRRLVRRWGYSRKAEAVAEMLPLTAMAMRAVGWDAICDSENISIQAAQFRMAYESGAKREVDMRRISPELRPRIAAGPQMTPRIERQAEVRLIVQQCAGGMKRIEEPKK